MYCSVATPAVSIKNVDVLWNINQLKNETDEFETSKYLVLRRGSIFDFILEVNSVADLKEDKVTLELRRGDRARYSRGTMFQALCGLKSKRHYQWKMEVSSLTICTCTHVFTHTSTYTYKH